MSETEANQKSEKRDGAALTATAYHEAGHAVVAQIVGRPIEKVTICPAQLQSGGSRLGACRIQKGRSKPTQDAIEDEALILLAGMVAESHFTGRYSQEGATMDLLAVQQLLSNRAKNERQLQRLVQRMLDKTEHILRKTAAKLAVKMIAAELVEKETISGRAVRHFVDAAAKKCAD